jgi:Flp pilus assembly protein TadD
LGLLEDAERDVRSGLAINTENRNRIELLRTQGIVAMLNGEYSESVSLLEEAQRLNGKPLSDVWLAQAQYYQGGAPQAETLLEDLLHSSSASLVARAEATLASLAAARGNRKRAEELLRTVLAGAYMDHHVAYSLGAAYAQLGEANEAVRWLRQAADTGFPCYPWYERDPLLQPLSNNAEFRRFKEVLQKSWESAKTRYAQSSS